MEYLSNTRNQVTDWHPLRWNQVLEEMLDQHATTESEK